MKPSSFDAELQSDWSFYVLAHGLPDLPHELDLGRAVPVAYWVGPTTGSVLHIRHIRLNHNDEPLVETDIEYFELVDGEWRISGSGGGGWPAASPLTRLDIPSSHVSLHGLVSSGVCTALYGEVGVDAAEAEVEQHGVVTRRPVEAPTGAFVVCAEGGAPFTVRVYAAGGGLVHEHHEPAFEPRMPRSFPVDAEGRVIEGAVVTTTRVIKVLGREISRITTTRVRPTQAGPEL